MDEQKIEQVQGRVELLRAVMKLSVAMNDLDTIEFQKKYFKYKFKVKAKEWLYVFQTFTSNLMSSLVDIDSSLLDKVYKAFDDSGIKISDKKEERISLVMFYVKLKSAMIDLEEIENRSIIFPSAILHKFTNGLVAQMEKQYPDIKDLKDENGQSINYLINYYNEAGKKILHHGEDN